MQELNDEEMNEVSGGGWGKTKKINFSKTTASHYFYPKTSVIVSGRQISLRAGASRQKITSAWGVKKVKISSGNYTYKTKNGKTETMIYVEISDIGKGYIHSGFQKYIVKSSPSKGGYEEDSLENWDLVN